MDVDTLLESLGYFATRAATAEAHVQALTAENQRLRAIADAAQTASAADEVARATATEPQEVIEQGKPESDA